MNHLSTLLGSLLYIATATSHAQTPWPDFMANLVHDPSLSPVSAALPTDVVVRPPESGVAQDKTRWSGVWTGWACLNRTCDISLAVERVTNEGASLVYVFASRTRKPEPFRLDATFENSELKGKLPTGNPITFRIRPDGNMDFLWQSADLRQWVAGILKKTK